SETSARPPGRCWERRLPASAESASYVRSKRSTTNAQPKASRARCSSPAPPESGSRGCATNSCADSRRAAIAARSGSAVRGRRALDDFIAGECVDRPLVVVLEDLHWGDQPSVFRIEEALRKLRDRPLLVMAFARPEVHDLFPRLWIDRELTEIRLGGLSPKAA